MQIASNDSQPAKANSPIDRTFEPNPNSTALTPSFEAEQNGPSVSIHDGITIDSGDPMTQTSEMILKSTKNSLRTLNETDPSSISIDRIPLPTNESQPIAVTAAGMQSRSNDRQSMKADSPIVASLDRGSNITD
jgi:hypothetical protein